MILSPARQEKGQKDSGSIVWLGVDCCGNVLCPISRQGLSTQESGLAVPLLSKRGKLGRNEDI